MNFTREEEEEVREGHPHAFTCVRGREKVASGREAHQSDGIAAVFEGGHVVQRGGVQELHGAGREARQQEGARRVVGQGTRTQFRRVELPHHQQHLESMRYRGARR